MAWIICASRFNNVKVSIEVISFHFSLVSCYSLHSVCCYGSDFLNPGE